MKNIDMLATLSSDSPGGVVGVMSSVVVSSVASVVVSSVTSPVVGMVVLERLPPLLTSVVGSEPTTWVVGIIGPL